MKLNPQWQNIRDVQMYIRKQEFAETLLRS